MADATLQKMGPGDFIDYRAQAVPAYADDLTRSRGMTPEAALAHAQAAFPHDLEVAVAGERTWLMRVLDDTSTPVGWLWVGPHPHRADGVFIYDIEIDQSHQGRGLGRATMLAAEALARDAGMAHIGLNVFGWNDRAKNLYDSLGYEATSTQMAKRL